MKKTYLVGALLFAMFGGMLLFAAPALAVTVTEHTVELNAKPGDSFERTMQLYDDSLQGATIYIGVANFKENPNDEGSAQLVTDPAEMKTDREYIKPSVDKLELPKTGDLVPFTYRVELPANAEPGTHLLSLVFSTQPPPAGAAGSSVSIGTNVLTNVFLKVAGATVDSIEARFAVGRFASDDPKLTPAERAATFKAKSFFLKPPVDFLIEVSNTGNTHQKPDGNIKIQNDLFGKSYEKISVNGERKIVLPEGQRFFPVDSFGRGIMLGKYRAKLTLIYGSPLKEYTTDVDFWIVPLVEIAIALAVIILLIVLILIIRHINKKRREKLEAQKEEKLRATLREEIKRSLIEQGEKPKPTPPTPAPPVVPPPAPPPEVKPEPPTPTPPSTP